MAEVAKQHLKVTSHQFYIGEIAPNVMNKIGGDIDFAILDTIHQLPGEILDFLVILPFLTPDAVICMHDVSEHQIHDPMSFANSTLLCSVDADKIFNLVPKSNVYDVKYPNIGAFQLTPTTRKNIISVMLSLVLPWGYLPLAAQLNAYSAAIHQNYDNDVCQIYDEAVKINLYKLLTRFYK